MTKIRATCPACGEIDLQPVDIALTVVRSQAAEVADGSHYRFDCPECALPVSKPADARIARLLATGGVAISVEHTSGAVGHPEQPSTNAAPFTEDDVLAFHALLEDDAWFEGLLDTLR